MTQLSTTIIIQCFGKRSLACLNATTQQPHARPSQQPSPRPSQQPSPRPSQHPPPSSNCYSGLKTMYDRRKRCHLSYVTLTYAGRIADCAAFATTQCAVFTATQRAIASIPHHIFAATKMHQIIQMLVASHESSCCSRWR